MNSSRLSEKDYDFIYSRVPRLCVDLIIKNKQGVLLSLREIEPGKGTWHLPGGRVKFRESLAAAAARIAKEELGIKVKLKKFLGFIEFLDEVQNKRLRHSVSLAFLASVESGKIQGTWQAGKTGFFKKLPKPIYREHGIFLREKFG